MVNHEVIIEFAEATSGVHFACKMRPRFLRTRQRLAAPLKESFKMYTTAKGRVVYLFYRLAQQKSMRGILKEKEWSTLFRPSAAIVKNPINSIYAISIYIYR